MPAGWHLRRLERSDLDRLEACALLAPHSSWARHDVAAELDIAQSRAWVLVDATDESRLGGLLVYWHVVDEVELMQIVVSPALRRQGVGAALMQHLVDDATRLHARRVHLEVRADNAAAISLYERFGFVTVGRRAGYYQADGTDATLMARVLEPPGA